MNLENCFRLIVPGVGLAMSMVLSQGCASDEGAPFHMYDSPLLEGRVESSYPRSREYDPLELGDHPEPAVEYAAKQGAGSGTPVPQPAPKPEVAERDVEPPDTRPSPPALATRTEGKPQAQSGAPVKTEVSARASSENLQTSDVALDDTQPALAADYIWSVYRLNGVDFSAEARRSVPKLFRECKERGKIYHSSRPAIGDIVFFHNTDDFNDDGRNNDWYTHVALVESHGSGGQVALLGYRDGAVERFTMNLESPDAAKTRHGEVANAQLRPKRSEDAPFTQYLAGQLFAGTCSALGDSAEMVVIDNWKPGMELDAD